MRGGALDAGATELPFVDGSFARLGKTAYPFVRGERRGGTIAAAET